MTTEDKRAKRKRSAAEEDARNALLAAGIDVDSDDEVRAAIAAMLAPPPPQGEVWYSKGELCVKLGVSMSTLNRRVKIGDAPELRRVMGQWKCSQGALDSYIARTKATKTTSAITQAPQLLHVVADGGRQGRGAKARVRKAQRDAGAVKRVRGSAHDPPGTLYDKDGFRLN